MESKISEMGNCILCGNYAELTGEHIFAQWIGAHVQKIATLEARYFYSDYVFNGRKISYVEDLLNKGGQLNAKIDVLCEPCNSEWSSAIQNETSEILKPVMDGKSYIFTERHRKLLAVWASLFVVVRQFKHPKLRAIHKAQRETFRRSRTRIEGKKPKHAVIPPFLERAKSRG